MRTPNIKRLSLGDLVSLRSAIDRLLSGKRDELQRQLAELDGPIAVTGRKLSTKSLKGRKVAPKYRDPATGDTWAARGARPRWLVARLKQGKKLDDFLIDKSVVAASRKVSAAKKSRRKKK
jgi:DNA-binding protein H-NS